MLVRHRHHIIGRRQSAYSGRDRAGDQCGQEGQWDQNRNHGYFVK